MTYAAGFFFLYNPMAIKNRGASNRYRLSRSPSIVLWAMS